MNPESTEELTIDHVLLGLTHVAATPWGERNLAGNVYHYTSHGGLLGIIRRRVIYASNISYLNDASEISYPRAVIASVLEQAKE
jgi:hypothetical protein